VAVLEVAFHVPQWVEAGVAAGELHVFGGVVRDNAGQIVLHLREAIRNTPRNKVGPIALAVGIGMAVGALAAGGVYYVYTRRSRKGRLLAALEAVDGEMSTYLVHAQQRALTPDDVESLSTALAAFVDVWHQPKFRDVEISVPDDVYQRLQDFLASLRAFNEAAQHQLPALPKPPAAMADGSSTAALFDDLLGQVRYQESILDRVRPVADSEADSAQTA